MLNGEVLTSTLQIPENKLKKGVNTVVVEMKKDAEPENLLVASTVQLHSVNSGNKTTYDVTAYGKNVLTFKNLTKSIKIIDSDEQEKECKKIKMDNFECIEFYGRGKFKIIQQ